MLRARNLMIIIILFVFGVGVVSYYNEFNTISDTVVNLDYTVKMAVDSSINQSMMSDDFFGANSNYGGNTDKEEVTPNTLWVRNNNHASLVDAVYRYNQSGGNYNSMQSAYPADSLNVSSQLAKYFKDEFQNTEFRQFYDYVKSSGKFNMQVKSLVDGELQDETICRLDLMGTKEIFPGYSTSEYKDVQTIEKDGIYGKYMLTPYALGVTYVNRRTLLPVLKSNLEMLFNAQLDCRGNEQVGCLDKKSMYYEFRTNGHGSPESGIINNGVFELDIDSVDVKTEYIIVDINGDNSGLGLTDDEVNNILDRTIGKLKVDEERLHADGSVPVVVAKVTASMNVYLQYSSPLMQRVAKDKHLCIQDGDTGCVRYEYTTYKAIIN